MNSGQTRKISVPTSPAAIATTALNSENPSGATSQPAAAKPTEITENTALSRRKTLSVALMAVGGAAIASGAVTGIVAMKRGKQLESNYPNGVPDSETDKMDSVDKLALTTDILMGVGIVSAAIGTILLLRSKKDRALAPVPVIGSGVAGLQLEGRF